jgi:DNA-binding transcriptional regulator YdaS (Cro superfamily)
MQVQALIDKAAKLCGSQNRLADELRVSSGRLSEWRTGKSACPDEKIVELAEIAGLDPEQTWHRVRWEKLRKMTRAARGAVVTLAYGVSVGVLSAAGEALRTMYRTVNRSPAHRASR